MLCLSSNLHTLSLKIHDLNNIPSWQSSPLYPELQPSRQEPFMWWHCSELRQWPHLFVHSGPNVLSAHSIVEKTIENANYFFTCPPCKHQQYFFFPLQYFTEILYFQTYFIFTIKQSIIAYFFHSKVATNLRHRKKIKRNGDRKNQLTLFTVSSLPARDTPFITKTIKWVATFACTITFLNTILSEKPDRTG